MAGRGAQAWENHENSEHAYECRTRLDPRHFTRSRECPPDAVEQVDRLPTSAVWRMRSLPDVETMPRWRRLSESGRVGAAVTYMSGGLRKRGRHSQPITRLERLPGRGCRHWGCRLEWSGGASERAESAMASTWRTAARMSACSASSSIRSRTLSRSAKAPASGTCTVAAGSPAWLG